MNKPIQSLTLLLTTAFTFLMVGNSFAGNLPLRGE